MKNAISLSNLVKSTVEELEKLRVTCDTCPVNKLCKSNQTLFEDDNFFIDPAGVYKCTDCGATSVKIKSKDGGFLIIDCGSHNFKIVRQIKPCELCDGKTAKFHFLFNTNGTRKYLLTTFAKVPVKTRLRVLSDSFDDWSAVVKQRDKALEKYIKNATKAAEQKDK